VSTEYYRDQPAWRELQRHLPAEFRLSDTEAPEERFWSWRGHEVHVERFPVTDATAKVVLHHGVGTNGRQLTLLLGRRLAAAGIQTVALDNLGYGLTRMAPGSVPTYADWVDLVADFVIEERRADPRPTFLFGLSAGGMLAYHVAARLPVGSLDGIIGMCFLDQRDQVVRDLTASAKVVSRVGGALGRLVAGGPLGGLRLPMRLVSKMTALANDPAALKVLLRDRTSAGNSVSVRFLDSYLHHEPAVEPEEFDRCPVLLTQPARDRWTPLELSEPFLDRLTRVPTGTVLLDEAGHYPLEQPGLDQLGTAVTTFVRTGKPMPTQASGHAG
jgi:alpha-beta hydrolase superfamily lysophospholipase